MTEDTELNGTQEGTGNANAGDAANGVSNAVLEQLVNAITSLKDGQENTNRLMAQVSQALANPRAGGGNAPQRENTNVADGIPDAVTEPMEALKWLIAKASKGGDVLDQKVQERLDGMQNVQIALMNELLIAKADKHFPDEKIYEAPPQMLNLVLNKLHTQGGIKSNETPEKAFKRHWDDTKKELNLAPSSRQEPPSSLKPSSTSGGTGRIQTADGANSGGVSDDDWQSYLNAQGKRGAQMERERGSK